MNCRIHQLPDPLIIDILSRVCAKTILICRCVCKPWLFLTSDSHFARLHYQSNSSPISGIGILLSNAEKLNKLDFYHMEEEHGEFKTRSISFNLPTIGIQNSSQLKLRNSSQLKLRNSCKGFLCLSNEAQSPAIYICNPMLGEHIRIPPPSRFIFHLTNNVSLGFCHQTNEYKVLKTTVLSNNKLDLEVEIYTVGTRVWRSIRKAPGHIGIRDSSPVNSLVDGAPHWLARDNRTIWFFDFGSEQFQALPTPSRDDGFESSSKWKLGVVKGCLSLYRYKRDVKWRVHFEMWVMEYGLQNSWTRVLVLPENSDIHTYHVRFQPFMRLSNGEILMMYNNHTVVRYDPADKKEVEDAGFIRTRFTFKAIAFSPCFVSLDDISKGEEVKRLQESANVSS